MSTYYSSEAGLCLLYGQLSLLTIFCLPENNEDWGQSESEGKAGRQDPTWNYRGDTTESLKWRKCVPETNLNCTVLVRGGMWSLTRPIGTFWGGWAGGSLLRVSLLRLLRGLSHPPQSLLRPLSSVASRPVRCPPLFCSYRLSFLPFLILWAPSGQAGDSGITRPPSSQWAALALPSSRAGLMGCLVFITEAFLALRLLPSRRWDVQGN